MLNLSCGGVFIRTEGRQVASDTPVELIFDLGEKAKDISMRGRVIRVESGKEGTDVGVEFTNLFSLSHKTVQEYLGKNLN
jgi:Tfp pilus assembly protein PilZ